MTAVAVSLSILALALGLALAFALPALVKKTLANGEALLLERKAKQEAEHQRDQLGAKLTYETARAEDAQHQLEATQRLYNAAVAEIAELESKVVVGETTEQITDRINRRIAAIANPLEVPE